MRKRQNIIFTSSVESRHQCSNSANPAFTYSPLLIEQHSLRKRRLDRKLEKKINKKNDETSEEEQILGKLYTY